MSDVDIDVHEDDNGDFVARVDLTEPECDVARSTTHSALSNGAIATRTSYSRSDDEYFFTVRALSEEKARKACEAWLESIADEIDD